MHASRSQVILQDEELDSARFSLDDLASLTDGYTGSDLRNLCVAAAYR
jgi:SpoVK/Ycf46/Vps4 family AAA+-type ATPase